MKISRLKCMRRMIETSLRRRLRALRNLQLLPAGFDSRHNTKYWSGAPYYGFGNSAHSYDGNAGSADVPVRDVLDRGRTRTSALPAATRRWANERDVAKYVELSSVAIRRSSNAQNWTEEDMRSEAIFLGLRLMSGIDLDNYRARFGRDLREQFNGELDRLQDGRLDRNRRRTLEADCPGRVVVE